MHKIIACIDGSVSALSVCDLAAWSSRRLECPVELLHVLEKEDYPAQGDLSGNIGLGSREHLLEELAELDHRRSRLLLEQGRNMLEHARQRVVSQGAVEAATLQRHDSLVTTLQEFEADTRLLVMGRRGEAHEGETSVVGSHLESVIRTLHRPILVALSEEPLSEEAGPEEATGFTPPQRFMLAYDGSATADKALAMVARSPLLKGLPCHLVMAGEVSDKQKGSLAAAEQTLKDAGFEVISDRVGNEVVDELVDYAAQQSVDLLVMGAYGHSRIRQFLVGSITTEMLQKTRIPLLLLR